MRLFDHLLIQELGSQVRIVLPAERMKDFGDAEPFECHEILEGLEHRSPKTILQVSNPFLPVVEAKTDLVAFEILSNDDL